MSSCRFGDDDDEIHRKEPVAAEPVELRQSLGIADNQDDWEDVHDWDALLPTVSLRATDNESRGAHRLNLER